MPAVKWIIHLDMRGAKELRYRCKHVNYVTRTDVPGEEEFLFAPYSFFTVSESSANCGSFFVEVGVVCLYSLCCWVRVLTHYLHRAPL